MMCSSAPQLNKLPRALFLCRTKKKEAYFRLLSSKSIPNFNCHVQSYFNLPKSKVHTIPSDQLDDIVNRMEQEVFNGRSQAWMLVRAFVRYLFAVIIKILYSRLYAFISKSRPSLVCLWNGQKWQDNIFHSVNKNFNIPVAYFENGLLPNTTTLDFNGINAHNSVPNDATFYHRYSDVSKTSQNRIKGRKYVIERKANDSLVIPKKYVLVPFQKDRDTQILDNSPWVKSMEQLFHIVIEALELCQCDDLSVVFRRHPSEKNQYRKLMKLAEENDRVFFDQQSDLEGIIRSAECVVTINSTVGLESLLLDRKVITLGDSFYSIDSLVQTASSTGELVNRLDAISSFMPNTKFRNRFVNYLEEDYVIKGDWSAPCELHYEAIKARIERALLRPRL